MFEGMEKPHFRQLVNCGGCNASPQCQQNLFSMLFLPPHFKQTINCLTGFKGDQKVLNMHCAMVKPKAKPKPAEKASLTIDLFNLQYLQ